MKDVFVGKLRIQEQIFANNNSASFLDTPSYLQSRHVKRSFSVILSQIIGVGQRGVNRNGSADTSVLFHYIWLQTNHPCNLPAEFIRLGIRNVQQFIFVLHALVAKVVGIHFRYSTDGVR